MKLVKTEDLIRLDSLFSEVCHDITSLLAVEDSFNDGGLMTGCSTCAICNEVIQQWNLLPNPLLELPEENSQDRIHVWKHYTTQAEIDHVTSERHQAQKTLIALAGT